MAKTPIKNLKSFIKNHKSEMIVLLAIILIGAFFRLYKINEYMTFLGDEGRDAIIVRRFITEKHPPLIGPGTSIGNMYLGPLYYYFMALPLLIANFSPVGPAVAIALLGILTIVLIWWMTREWFGVKGGLISSFLYAIAPTIIIYSRSSWNPNIMPFFALLCIFSIWKVWSKENYKWLLVLGVAFAFVLQSHYLGLLLLPTLGIFWILAFSKARKSKNTKYYILYTLYSVVILAILMSPLVIFDARHGWRNFTAMKTFFTERQSTVSVKPWNSLPKTFPELVKINTRLLGARNVILGEWLTVGLLAVVAWVVGAYKEKILKKEKIGYLILILWIGFGLIGLGLYKQEIYDHYYGFLMPAPFILFGGLCEHLLDKAKLRGLWLVGTIIIIIAAFNLTQNPLKYAPNKQLERSNKVTDEIITKANGQPFNFAVIAERNYEDAYLYFLKIKKAPLLEIDPQIANETIAKELYVVCEMPEGKCDPTHNSKAQVANFGWSKIEDQWNSYGVTIYKLIHSR